MSKSDWWGFKSFLKKRSADFHEKYYKGIELFETGPPPVGFNYSWESFTKYVAANPGNHAHNHHWKVENNKNYPKNLNFRRLFNNVPRVS